jgi:hypothetical protein
MTRTEWLISDLSGNDKVAIQAYAMLLSKTGDPSFEELIRYRLILPEHLQTVFVMYYVGRIVELGADT